MTEADPSKKKKTPPGQQGLASQSIGWAKARLHHHREAEMKSA